jgi:L-iditol 2-dehydrogenase
VVVEAAGAPEAVGQALDLVRDGGRVVVCGQYTDNGPVTVHPHLQINRKHVQIRGCWGSDFSHFYRAIAVMARHHGRVPWREMVTARYGLGQCNEALAAMAGQRVLKAAIVPGLAG